MATLILLNSISLRGAVLRPGSPFSDGTAEAEAARAAGGVLWPADDAFLSALQGKVLTHELVQAQALRQLGVPAATAQATLAAALAEEQAETPEIFAYWGDSETAGEGAGNEAETGPRGSLEQLLREHGYFDVQGSIGYGGTKFGPQTWGGFGLKLNRWEHDGHSGQPVGFELPIFGWDTGTGVFTSTTHFQTVDRFIQLVGDRPGDVPAPFSETELYFVNTAPTATTFTLKSTSAGATILPTQAFAGRPIRARVGLRAAVNTLYRAYTRRPTRVLAISGLTNDAFEFIVTRGVSPADAAPIMIQRLVAYFEDMLRVGAPELRTIFYGGFPEFKAGSSTGANLANLTALRDLVYPRISSALAQFPRVVFRDAWSNFPQSVFQTDGVHVRRAGNRLVARNMSQAVTAVLGSLPGRSWPRSILRRRRAPKVLLADAAASARVTMNSVYPLGTRNVAFGWTYHPRAGDLINDATVRFMFWFGSAAQYTNGAAVGITRVAVGSTSSRFGVSVYVGAGAPKQSGNTAPFYNAELIAEATSYVFAVVIADGWVSLFINGRRINRTEVGAQNFTDSTAYLGYWSAALPAAQGYYRDYWHASGSEVTDEGAIAAAEAFYAEGERWPGTVDFRPLDEGSLSVINSAAGLTAGSFTAATWGNRNDGVDTVLDDPVI